MANPDDSNDNAAPQRPCQVSVVKSFAVDLPYYVGFRCPGSGGEPEGEYTKYNFNLLLLNSATFFDARFAESKEKEKHVSLGEVTDKGVAPARLLGQVWIQQDFIRFAPLQSEWVEKNWPADFLVTSTAEKYNRVEILTNPTPALRDMLSRNAASPDAFSLAVLSLPPGSRLRCSSHRRSTHSYPR
jgi:hypothetical protein